jgi:hypothetical protein
MSNDFETHPVGTRKRIQEVIEQAAINNEMIRTLKLEVARNRETLSELHDRYYTLLWAVETKTPGESRHDTALRYIRQSETCNDDARAAGDDVGEKYE